MAKKKPTTEPEPVATPAPDDGVACSNCRFWDVFKTGDQKQESGYCRRNAPRPSDQYNDVFWDERR